MHGPSADAGYAIRISAATMVHERISIKHGDSFVLTDRRGDLPADPGAETGFYIGGTRHLSGLTLFLAGERPILLSSSLADDDVLLSVVETNSDVVLADGTRLPKESVLLVREITVQDGRFHQRIQVMSYAIRPVALSLEALIQADFKDIFEVRGYPRKGHGEILPLELSPDRATVTYRGLDQVVRRTIIRIDPAPATLVAEGPGVRAAWSLSLAPRVPVVIELAISGGLGGVVEAAAPDTRKAVAKVRREQASWERASTRVFTSDESLNALLERASADLRLMCTRTPEGLVPYAGIPWYSCPFGRDSIWTSWMTLSLQPRVAAGTLRYLAKRQATERDDFLDAEPGKILHEMRTGEMANLREIPFIPYYGSVDGTPLFVCLLDRYVAWTGDTDLLGQLWPAAKAALDWVRTDGDLDGDRLIEYRRRSPLGLSNQGWKDSADAIFHKDGSLPEGPIALVEVQGYAYAALLAGSRLAGLTGETGLANGLAEAARSLQARFEAAFWSDSLGTYAVALDGRKHPCEILTSNPGHALWAGIASGTRAERTVKLLLSSRMFSGWGVRTLAEGEARYNPISYHDGSIWPHDNAILARGMKRYGQREAAARVASAILDAAQHFEDRRVPELYCGFPRQPRHAPIPYPVACRPQAWSAATIFSLVETFLGLTIDGFKQRVLLEEPSLPAWLEWVELTGLPVGSRRADLRVERKAGGISVRSSGEARVVVKK